MARKYVDTTGVPNARRVRGTNDSKAEQSQIPSEMGTIDHQEKANPESFHRVIEPKKSKKKA